MIIENTTFQYTNDNSEEKIRVIYVDKDYKHLYYINLNGYIVMPKEEMVEVVDAEINNNILISVPDPYVKNINEENIPKVQKDKRDFEWEIIQKYWEEYKIDLLNKRRRNEVFEKIAIDYNIAKGTVKKIFTRFWQRGMTKNALLPDYDNSGGKGEERKLKEKKVGRPRKTNYSGETVEGINITEDIRKIIEISIDKFYRRKEKPTIKDTYNQMLKQFFADRYTENREVKYKVWDKTRIPTYHQFYHWFKKFEDVKKDMYFRESAKAFDLKERSILGNSVMETDGPGTRFQIDATAADVYLLSSLNRNRIIGRPVVYAVMDVYSRLVTGLYVGLEGPSWIGAMMALDNMVADKVEFCKKYDIEITKEQWPAHHMPEILIADRGELEGYSTENLTNNLNIKIENTSPYRGDLKGIVERNFRTTNEIIKRKAPGAIQKEFRKRGDRDYRLDATLTLEEFTQIFIKLVLHHNKHIISKYPMDKEMISDEFTPTPVNLWSWGIKNKKGRLRVIERDIMRLNLLPKGSAHISRSGLKFSKLFYSSKKAIEEQWFIKSKHRWIEVVYDPRNMNQIYISYEDGRGYEICYLLEKSKQYKDCILEEILFQEELKEELIEMEACEQIQSDIDLNKDIENMIKQAKKEKEKTVIETVSKSRKLKGIKENRKLEKEINREKEAFEISREEKEGIVKDFNKEVIQKNEEEKDTRRLSLMEKIKRQRDEKLGK